MLLFLIGPSSAGKTSLAIELLEQLPERFIFIEADRTYVATPKNKPVTPTAEAEDIWAHASALSIRGYAEGGFNLIVERGDIWSVRRGPRTAKLFTDHDAFLVGLRWEIEILRQRETTRDRIFPGTAEQQARWRGWDLPYDFVVDTASLAPAEAAGAVVSWLATGPAPAGINRLAAEGERQ